MENTQIVETVEETDIETLRKSALAAYLSIDVDDVEVSRYDDTTFDADGAEYLVLTDEEADDKAQEYVTDSLWAFNASFLSGETGLDEDIFTAIQSNDKCESNNDAMLALIKSTCGLDSFVESAISADGRGHFMSSYDGEENEQGEFYIYRTN